MWQPLGDTNGQKSMRGKYFSKVIFFTRTELAIFGGRHPVVELGLIHAGIQFVKNDCVLAKDNNANEIIDEAVRFALITG